MFVAASRLKCGSILRQYAYLLLQAAAMSMACTQVASYLLRFCQTYPTSTEGIVVIYRPTPSREHAFMHRLSIIPHKQAQCASSTFDSTLYSASMGRPLWCILQAKETFPQASQTKGLQSTNHTGAAQLSARFRLA